MVLREAWNFSGYVTSDSGAVRDILRSHHYTKNWTSTVAAALSAGDAAHRSFYNERADFTMSRLPSHPGDMFKTPKGDAISIRPKPIMCCAYPHVCTIRDVEI